MNQPNDSQVYESDVKCICCKEPIEGVQKKSSVVILALSYPERWDDDLEGLICNLCFPNIRGALAWMHHGGLRTCTKIPARGVNHD